MNRETAKSDIMKAIDEHENARLTRASLTEMVNRAVDAAYDAGYNCALDEEFGEEDEEYEVSFEDDMDETFAADDVIDLDGEDRE